MRQVLEVNAARKVAQNKLTGRDLETLIEQNQKIEVLKDKLLHTKTAVLSEEKTNEIESVDMGLPCALDGPC
ncbi:MAG: hypothetical protein H6Q04_268 [Acidobacteria bacterium]|nr:hypothetical protein [Acidobacteriota bacterium]